MPFRFFRYGSESFEEEERCEGRAEGSNVFNKGVNWERVVVIVVVFDVVVVVVVRVVVTSWYRRV